MAATIYYTEKVLDEHRGTAWTRPTNYYLGVGTTAPKRDGSGVTEPASAAGYARATIERSVAFLTRSGAVMSNVSALTWVTSTGAWLAGAPLAHVYLFDEPGVGMGNLLISDPVEVAVSITASGQTLQIPAGLLRFTLDLLPAA